MSQNNKIIVIAEAGVNHNGSIKIAKKLVDIAKKSGADYIKFQSFFSEELVTDRAKLANYQKKNLKLKISQKNMLAKYELSEKKLNEIYSYCKIKKIKFLSTPFDVKSLNLLKKFKMDYIKIPSGEITNFPFLEIISKLKKPILLSTGMSTNSEINDALKVIKKIHSKITLLHCTSSYPAIDKDLNLNALKTIKKKFRLPIGYSDHSVHTYTPILAAGFGARVIEKHFTLDQNLDGPDHKASLNPKGLFEMVKLIRRVEIMLGSFLKKPTKDEKKTKKLVRKSLVALKDIKVDQYFDKKNLGIKRPGVGLHPKLYRKLLGQKSKKNFKKGSLIKI